MKEHRRIESSFSMQRCLIFDFVGMALIFSSAIVLSPHSNLSVIVEHKCYLAVHVDDSFLYHHIKIVSFRVIKGIFSRLSEQVFLKSNLFRQ